MASIHTSIRRKLVAVVMMTSISVLVLTLAGFIIYEVITVRQSMVDNLTALSRVMASASTAAMAFADPEEGVSVLSALGAEENVTQAVLFTNDGKVFATYPRSAKVELTNLPRDEKHIFVDGALRVFEPVVQSEKVLGTLFVESSLRQLHDRYMLYGEIVIGVFLASAIVAYLISSALQKRITVPILALADLARSVSQKKDYSVRSKKLSDDEVGLLTDAFNEMLVQIQSRDEALRQNEAQLENRVRERTSELSAMNKELEAFTYSVSHDLRSPLRHIDAYGQILQEEYARELPAEAVKYVERMRHGTQNLGRLVDDLLGLARVGRAEIKKEPFNLSMIVGEVVSEIQQDVVDRKIEWLIGVLPTVECDPVLMKQVFANLISNAVKYSRTRPVAKIEIRLEATAKGPAIAIRDNGVGFNMKFSNKLFGVFQRLHRAEQFEGTGVGLAIVERIVSKHGGEIWAEAEVEKGATFYFTISGLQS